MPSDLPRSAADEPDDALLPDELRALADQLRSDAAWLEGRFPAGEVATSNLPRVARRAVARRRWRHAAAVAAVLAACAVTWAVWPGKADRQGGAITVHDVPHGPARGAGDGPARDDAVRPQSDRGGARVVPVGSGPAVEAPIERASLPLPTVRFDDLSPSQQEAVLDVIEGRGERDARLSL
jgi:hypothetical protein